MGISMSYSTKPSKSFIFLPTSWLSSFYPSLGLDLFNVVDGHGHGTITAPTYRNPVTGRDKVLHRVRASELSTLSLRVPESLANVLDDLYSQGYPLPLQRRISDCLDFINWDLVEHYTAVDLQTRRSENTSASGPDIVPGTPTLFFPGVYERLYVLKHKEPTFVNITLEGTPGTGYAVLIDRNPNGIRGGVYTRRLWAFSYDPDDAGGNPQTYMIYSDDDGMSWSNTITMYSTADTPWRHYIDPVSVNGRIVAILDQGASSYPMYTDDPTTQGSWHTASGDTSSLIGNLPVNFAHVRLAQDKYNHNRLFWLTDELTTGGWRVLASFDGGLNWTEVKPDNGITNHTPLDIAVAKGVVAVLYSAPDGYYIAYSFDSGATWSSWRTTLGGNTPYAIAVDMMHPTITNAPVAYITADNNDNIALYKTFDFQSLHMINPDLHAGSQLASRTHTLKVGLYGWHLWLMSHLVGNGTVIGRSIDGGLNWTFHTQITPAGSPPLSGYNTITGDRLDVFSDEDPNSALVLGKY